MIPFPNKKYSIIYADPPWKYNSRANHKTTFRGGAEGHYPLMSMDEIKALRVGDLGEKNSALFLWATLPYINEQIKLFDHWGYRYRTVAFAWIKTNKNNGFPFFGVGHYTRSNLEVCLLGIRGQLTAQTHKISQVIVAPRREHSRKPDEVRDKIVELFGDLPRIELFARGSTSGWDTWGDEV